MQFQEMQKELEWALNETFPQMRQRYIDMKRARELAAGLVIPEINPPAPEVRISRNDPCPCGSERKYKRCHGRTREPD